MPDHTCAILPSTYICYHDSRRNYRGMKLDRDLVHFVPYATGRFYFVYPEDFASAVLSELPRQLTDYMTKKKIKPLRT